MIERCVAIRLKVPDNTAYTALVALRRLGIDVGRVERALVVPAGAGDDAAVLERIRSDETLFNPNLHEIEVRQNGVPERGELMISERPSTSRLRRYAQDDNVEGRGAQVADHYAQDDNVEGRGAQVADRYAQDDNTEGSRAQHLISWRLYDLQGKPASSTVLERARDALLCNPAIEVAELT